MHVYGISNFGETYIYGHSLYITSTHNFWNFRHTCSAYAPMYVSFVVVHHNGYLIYTLIHILMLKWKLTLPGYIYWPDTNNQLIDNTVQMGTKMTYSYVCVALYHNDDVILGRNNITQPCEFGHIPVIGYCAAIRITSVAFQQVLHTSCCICCICWFAPCRSQARMKRWEVYHKIKYS